MKSCLSSPKQSGRSLAPEITSPVMASPVQIPSSLASSTARLESSLNGEFLHRDQALSLLQIEARVLRESSVASVSDHQRSFFVTGSRPLYLYVVTGPSFFRCGSSRQLSTAAIVVISSITVQASLPHELPLCRALSPLWRLAVMSRPPYPAKRKASFVSNGDFTRVCKIGPSASD